MRDVIVPVASSGALDNLGIVTLVLRTVIYRVFDYFGAVGEALASCTGDALSVIFANACR